MKFLQGIPEGVRFGITGGLYGFHFGKLREVPPSTPRRHFCVIGGKYFFNPSMQYIMGLIEALGYITSGTLVETRAPKKAPIGCLWFDL